MNVCKSDEIDEGSIFADFIPANHPSKNSEDVNPWGSVLDTAKKLKLAQQKAIADVSKAYIRKATTDALRKMHGELVELYIANFSEGQNETESSANGAINGLD